LIRHQHSSHIPISRSLPPFTRFITVTATGFPHNSPGLWSQYVPLHIQVAVAIFPSCSDLRCANDSLLRLKTRKQVWASVRNILLDHRVQLCLPCSQTYWFIRLIGDVQSGLLQSFQCLAIDGVFVLKTPQLLGQPRKRTTKSDPCEHRQLELLEN